MGSVINCIGMGMVTPVGTNVDEFRNSLTQRKSGITSMKLSDYRKVIETYAGVVNDIPQEEKFYTMAEKSLLEALEDAGLKRADLRNNYRVGIVLGTSLGNMTAKEKRFFSFKEAASGNKDKSFDLSTELLGSITKMLREKLCIKGPSYTISNTCVTGINVIAVGSHMITSGQVDICLVGSVEVLSSFIFSGMDSLKALSRNSELKPFSKQRDGIVFGEGAGVIVLAGNKNFNAIKNYALINGYAVTNDAVHLTAPDKEAGGLLSAIKLSMKKSKISTNEIDCIFCCGTGTKYNDEMQALAIHKVWSDKGLNVPVTSIKPLIGHTLAAAGIIESIAAIIMMNSGYIVPIGEEFEVDPNIKNIPLLFQPKYGSIKNAMLLSSGFTGVNGALVLSKKI